MKFLIFALALLSFPTGAEAMRTVAAPRFTWHDWYQTGTWCDGNATTNGLFRTIEISLTNISAIDQHVKITCTAYGMSAGHAGVSGIIRISLNGPETSAADGSAVASDITVPANASYSTSCLTVYRGPSGGGPAGDWHLIGGFDIKFDVSEDRGALTGVMQSQMESTGCTSIDVSSSFALLVPSMRNASRTMLINGGRPF